MCYGMLNQGLDAACYVYMYEILVLLILFLRCIWLTKRMWQCPSGTLHTNQWKRPLVCSHNTVSTRVLFCFKVIQNYQTHRYVT
jgi:hypothetical protein